jgi:hypothetical protein
MLIIILNNINESYTFPIRAISLLFGVIKGWKKCIICNARFVYLFPQVDLYVPAVHFDKFLLLVLQHEHHDVHYAFLSHYNEVM